MRTTAVAALVAALSLSAGTDAQVQASYTFIDQKAPHSNPPLRWLFNVNLPRVGTEFVLGFNFGEPIAPCPVPGFPPFMGMTFHLLTGVSVAHVDLGTLGIPGWLYCSAEVITPNVFGGMRIPIPNAPGLIGATFTQQVLQFGPCPGLSRGLSRAA